MEVLEEAFIAIHKVLREHRSKQRQLEDGERVRDRELEALRKHMVWPGVDYGEGAIE